MANWKKKKKITNETNKIGKQNNMSSNKSISMGNR